MYVLLFFKCQNKYLRALIVTLVWYTASAMSWKFSSIHPGINWNFISLLLYEPCYRPISFISMLLMKTIIRNVHFTCKFLPKPCFQRDVISCLEFGVVSKCARICVQALSVCMLEMQEVMMRQLPSVLVRLSQISATSAMAIPLMEFLSSMSSLDSRPRVSFTSVALFMQHFITCFF